MTWRMLLCLFLAPIATGCGAIEDAKDQATKELARACVDHTDADEQTCACVAEEMAESTALEAIRDMIETAARGEVPPDMEQALRDCTT